MRNQWAGVFERLATSQTLILGGSAIIVGLATAAGVWIFKALIEFLRGLAFGAATGWTMVLIPLLGGLLVGLATKYW